MKKSIPLLSAALLGLGMLAAWHSISAEEEKVASTTTSNVDVSELISLVERIEALENRVNELERAESLVRQADSRGPAQADHPERLMPVSDPEDSAPAAEEDDEASQINGTKISLLPVGKSAASENELDQADEIKIILMWFK